MSESVAPGPTTGLDTTTFARRVVITIAALFIMRLGSQIPLPGLSEELVDQLIALSAGDPFGRMGADGVSILCLGLMPALNAALLAELLLLSAWLRGKAEASARARSQVRAAVVAASLFFAALQGYGIATALEMMDGAVDQPGAGFTLTVMATTVAATAFLLWLADSVSRFGLGRGFWVLLAAPLAANLLTDAARLYEGPAIVSGAGPGDSMLVAAFVIASVALVVVLVRADPSIAARDQLLWSPILATTVAGWAALPAALAMEPGSLEQLEAMSPQAPKPLIAIAVLVPLVTILRARALWRADEVTGSRARASGLGLAAGPGSRFLDQPAFRHALIVSATILAILLGARMLSATIALPLSFDGGTLILLTLVAADVMRRR